VVANKNNSCLTLQHAEMIHGVLQNPAMVLLEWFLKMQEIRIHNHKHALHIHVALRKLGKSYPTPHFFQPDFKF
jgi:hypothetical protein